METPSVSERDADPSHELGSCQLEISRVTPGLAGAYPFGPTLPGAPKEVSDMKKKLKIRHCGI